MKRLLRPIGAVVCVGLCSLPLAFAQGKGKDPITNFFTGLGFSNIPYVSQTDAVVGSVVYWSGSPDDGPTFMDPTDDVPKPTVTPGGTFIPAGSLEEVVNGGFELNLFGFTPSSEFNHYKTLKYSNIILDTTALKYQQIMSLLALNSPIDKEVHSHYEVGKQPSIFKIKYGTGVYSDGVYYIIGKVFSSTGSGDITQTDGTEIAATVSGDMPKCEYPDVPKDADKAGADKAGADKAGADKAGADKAGADKAGADKAGADKAGADKAKPAAKGVTAASSNGPSGGVKYCRKDSKTVHFDSAHPFPVAMYLWEMNLDPNTDYKTWKAKARVVAFVNPNVQLVK